MHEAAQSIACRVRIVRLDFKHTQRNLLYMHREFVSEWADLQLCSNSHGDNMYVCAMFV